MARLADAATTSSRVRRAPPARGIVAVLAALILLTTSGAAWALGATKARRYDGAATYYVSDGLDPQLPADAQAGTVVDVLKIGQVLVQGECLALVDPTIGSMAAGIVYRVINTGDDAVLVSTPWLDFSTPGPWVWLDPGEQDATFWAGQMAGADIGTQTMVTPFVVVDYGGTSATGTAAWTARTDDVADTAECMFSAQARG